MESNKDRPEENREDEVGYCNPPKEHRFKKGQSGNPKGRPKKEKSFSKLVQRELDEMIRLRVDGKTVTLTKREALAKGLVHEALQGKVRAVQHVLKIDTEQQDPDSFELDPADDALLENYIERHRVHEDPGDGSEDADS